MIELSSKDVWRAVLGELELQVPKPSFETWLRETEGLNHDDSRFVVGVPTPFAVEWLELRMYQSIHRAVERVVRRPLDVQFQVKNQALPGPAETADASGIAEAGKGLEEREARPAHAYANRTRGFNQRYTFSSFVVGPGSQLAYSASRAVVDSPGEAYNPLFIYSGVGLGKTHLLHAIGHLCAEQGVSALYVTSEQFTNDFISAIRNRSTEEFRDYYRSAEVLLMDDVQFLSGKEQTHEGFFHTFNDLHTSGRQVVITSDRPPGELVLLQDRMRSRFEWGLIADIEPPDLETRMAILAFKAAQLGVKLADGIIELIAKRVQSNVRDLEGMLNQILAYDRIMNIPITYEAVSNMLDSRNSKRAKDSIAPESILERVATHYGMDTETLSGPRRTKEVASARQVAMYLLMYELELSPTQIGRMLGGRNHATVIHGAGKVNGDIQECGPLRQDVLTIKEMIFS